MRPPTRLSITIETPGGVINRWGFDEHNPADAPSNLAFSSTMPGGFEAMSCTLPRKADVDYSDLEEFSTITVYGPGGETAWQGRLEGTPRTSGQQLTITPSAVGWQAALDDNQSAQMIYIDMDMTRWQAPTAARAQQRATGNVELENFNLQSGLNPALQCSLQAPWTAPYVGDASEAWYDANGIPLSALYYAFSNVNAGLTGSWVFQAFLSDDDVLTASDASSNLVAASGSGSLAASVATRDWAMVMLNFASVSGASDTVQYQMQWTYLAAVGNHGCPIRGALTSTGGIGVLASDVVRHAVTTWAPVLAVSRNGSSTIETSTYVIPQLAFVTPTKVSDIIAAAIQYGLVDWWVDEGPTFNLATRNLHGQTWQARVGPSGLQETGPQVTSMYNGVTVAYTDVTGVARSVTVYDTDLTNPVTEAGLTRVYSQPSIGTASPDAATQFGRRFLLESRQQSTAGQANIVGHVQSQNSSWFPAWAIRAGDWITFVDAHDPTPRRITRAQYTDSSRSCQIDLDSPPQDLAQTIARYTTGLATMGLQ